MKSSHILVQGVWILHEIKSCPCSGRMDTSPREIKNCFGMKGKRNTATEVVPVLYPSGLPLNQQ